MPERVLVSWIGHTDFRCSRGEEEGLGPVAGALGQRPFDRVTLLSDAKDAELKPYERWLRKQSLSPFTIQRVQLAGGPMNFGAVHDCAVSAVLETVAQCKRAEQGQPPELSFHVSPGTSVMAAVWIILSKTRFPAKVVASTREQGIYDLAVPFDISAEYIGELLQGPDATLREQSEARPPESPAFEQIISRSKAMDRVKQLAQKVAPRSASVLILGESGTGKELLARAIHRASGRRGHFIPVNCGAIPENLVEAELFGFEKGAFSGASAPRKGHFREAEGGTIFLDELGELPLPAQVKLLRALQEEEVTPVGASRPVKINVRVIAATNRNLTQRVAEGQFREDLFYRLAVAILELPPLRARQGDLNLLVDALLQQINEKSRNEPGYKPKKLSTGARSALSAHSWPGNIRELSNTLLRAAIWSEGETIKKDEMLAQIQSPLAREGAGLFERALSEDFSLEKLLDEVSRHYLARALEQSGGVKTKAAGLVGFKSHQRLTDWMERLGLEDR